jgi:hypothetical protein
MGRQLPQSCALSIFDHGPKSATAKRVRENDNENEHDWWRRRPRPPDLTLALTLPLAARNLLFREAKTAPSRPNYE